MGGGTGSYCLYRDAGRTWCVVVARGDITDRRRWKHGRSVIRGGGVRIYTMEQTQNNAFYYLVNVEGQDCLMYYSFDTEKAYMSYQYTLGYLLGGTLARKDEAQMMTYHAVVKDLDKTKWAEFAQKVNRYFTSGYLLMGIENQKLVYSTQDNRMTYEENFRWMVEDDIGTAMTWEKILDLYAQSTLDNDVLSPERVMYETTADLTHDGIADLVQTVQYSISYEFDLKMGSDTSAFVRVYRGLGDGSYESSPLWIYRKATDITHIAPWIEKGTILFVLDIWEGVFVSTEEDVYPASTYYDCVWSRDL